MKQKWWTLLFLICILLLLTACQGNKSVTPLSPIEAANLAAEWAAMEMTVLNGGFYEEGEYETFLYKGMNYRYLAGHIDSKKKLKAELRKSMTKKGAKRFIKENGIIFYKKRSAQPEAEVVSDLMWNVATVREVKVKKTKMVMELTIPIGETRTADKMKITYKYKKADGWRIDKVEK
ncbi:DL-endopeptidase inhibitor IseA family protein [Sporosarcina sp. Te-1]|uniref:DL-endopeptidase inhibitor IseA family protein n=1 Tax=Sporosarcina sp. Te-1 TaxID=2818390 RepID=UPI001A9CF223|nr:DL-endopeptidase inhibitor IseA family protein [Sporosarcina sp. Te-1]QTD41087.1 hypothetical protein J3U78_20550 [Sporosarcina sp. Te-1]